MLQQVERFALLAAGKPQQHYIALRAHGGQRGDGLEAEAQRLRVERVDDRDRARRRGPLRIVADRLEDGLSGAARHVPLAPAELLADCRGHRVAQAPA